MFNEVVIFFSDCLLLFLFIQTGKPRSDSTAKSVRTRPVQVTSTSRNIGDIKQSSSFESMFCTPFSRSQSAI